ncbi:DUF4153 domain-containing protein [Rhodohalobacter barkolensis]|uniref:DUF4153 domain-containing protein n=1 Tax=Rhodohalobacter barkolensis TaxID=2053187 RepID=A0A2N0VIJ4_9BACT|nr:DUF4153 domain-containing protein [Rhodohalobacter barkolensis]PKD44025.1 hypothetical protein CWD77_00670 [Rhodohalobacter barkolensis]
MIRLPSIQQITSNASATIRRFPFVLTFAILGTLGVILLVDLPWDQRDGYYWVRNFSWVSALSISLLLAISVLSESRSWNPIKRYLSSGAAVLLLAVYYLFLPEDFEPSNSEAFYRYSLLFLSSHLLVSFAPYLGDKSVQDFWAYNKTLFLRILLSVLYVGVLYVGLTIAMYSLEVLLEFDIEGKRYGQLAIFLIGIFGTWFFLSGVPHPNQLTDEEKAYPKGLRIFVQYVLIPLIVVYIVILYLYTGKIIIEWQWPNGWVAHLVLNFSIAGILGLLLLYPIQDEDDHKWVRLFSKGYYIALIPLIILLMLSIWVRISEYGVTVNRYYVATLAVWLTGVVIYFLISKVKDIRVIPTSLFLIMILISFGPLSAFEVSERSQLSRLEYHLEEHGLFSENGTVIKTENEIPFNDRKQISSGITYLLDLKGVQSIQPYFEEDLKEVLANKDTMNVVSDAQVITGLIGIDYVSNWEMEEGDGSGFATFQVQKRRTDPVPLQGYDHYVGEIEMWLSSQEFETTIGERVYTISLKDENLEIHITEKATGRSLVFELKPFIEELPETGAMKIEALSIERMTLEQQNESLKVKLVFNSITGQRQNGEITSLNANFGLYFSFEE